MNEQTTDLTAAITPENPETHKKIRKGVTVVFIAAGVILLIDDQVRRFTERKRVTVTVQDKPEN